MTVCFSSSCFRGNVSQNTIVLACFYVFHAILYPFTMRELDSRWLFTWNLLLPVSSLINQGKAGLFERQFALFNHPCSSNDWPFRPCSTLQHIFLSASWEIENLLHTLCLTTHNTCSSRLCQNSLGVYPLSADAAQLYCSNFWIGSLCNTLGATISIRNKHQ